MSARRWFWRWVVIAVGVAGTTAWAGQAPVLDDASCLKCHAVGKVRIPLTDNRGDKRQLASVDIGRLARSVHARMQCVACHIDIVDSRAGHRKAPGVAKADCAECHRRIWMTTTGGGRIPGEERMGVVMQNIDAYQQSFHARPDVDNPARPKAACADCHATHEFGVPRQGTPERRAWRLTIPETCGTKCHQEEFEDYESSVHGKVVLVKADPSGPICIDCHTAHSITRHSEESFKLKNVQVCGGCHRPQLSSYRETYHGQVNRLGFTYTAKCFDCHSSHAIRSPKDPKSKVHPNNKLRTCMRCHNDRKPGMHDATVGFVTFGPHANSHDYTKYPQMWIAGKSMAALLMFVFLFFSVHTGLWYYREWKDHNLGKPAPHIDVNGLQLDDRKHFRRFTLGWRIGHLVFAMVTMTLVLTGTTTLFADSSWAPKVAAALGGPKVMGFVHRIAAALFIGVFMAHFVYVTQKLLRDRNFHWFGPDSLVPNWKDFTDCRGMFKWFVGKGPKPLFDRWTYFEKFDYWAVFWGVNIIGWSGLMLAFPHVTATYLPGWVFNVATLVHGQEAFLAAAFLFTVHFFNNHFRPDKLPPPDVVMFTGTQSLDEFRRDHPAQYQRLLAAGELERRLVDAPAKAMTLGSKILGLMLIGIGLTLLVLVGIGFFGA